MMVELTEAHRAVLRAILAAPVAWRTPAELALSLGADLEETTDHLATLDVGGWLVAWEDGGSAGPAVTLSPAGAARLDARLVEHGPDETPRWATRDQGDPPMHRALGVFRNDRAAALELVIDPRVSPDREMEAAEEAEGRLAAPDRPRWAPRSGRMPRPTLLLGTGTSPWPGPVRIPSEGRTCPVCGDRPLGPTIYCLLCDRWGLDHRVEDDVIPDPPEIPEFREPVTAPGRRKIEARARKAKRRRRMAAIEVSRKQQKPRGHRG